MNESESWIGNVYKYRRRLSLVFVSAIAVIVVLSYTCHIAIPYGYLLLIPFFAFGILLNTRLFIATGIVLTVNELARHGLVVFGVPLVNTYNTTTGLVNTFYALSLIWSLIFVFERVERKLSRDKVYESSNRLLSSTFSEFANNISEHAIVALDVNGNVLSWNKGVKKILDYEASEVIGKHFRIFFSLLDRKSKLPEKMLRQSGTVLNTQQCTWLVTKHNNKVWGGVSITKWTDAEQGDNGYALLMEDLTTELRLADSALKAMFFETKNREMEEFAYITSHDLQEPLRTITSYSQLLEQKYSDKLDKNGERILSTIVKSSTRMRKLITDILDYSRLGLKSSLTDIDVSTLLNRVMDDLHLTIQESGAIIKFKRNLPKIAGFEVELGLMFQNLIVNAIKFAKTGDRPFVEITIKDLGEFWQFAIADKGIGIGPAYLTKIFAMFQRLHLNSDVQGTGIGLTHCRRIAEIHGGRIWVESKENHGSTFYFTVSKNLN